MNERVSYEPPADVQKTGVEDAASRLRFRTFSAGALNFHSKSTAASADNMEKASAHSLSQAAFQRFAA